MKINIIYNLSFERKRIEETMKNIEFFNTNGYKIYLPDNINNIKNNFNIILFDKLKKELLVWLQKDDILPKLEKYFNYKFSEIKLYLTQYWTLWSYNPKNEIIININTKRNILQIFLHELIHLYIHKDIEKNNIIHWEKEALVDNIFIYLFPEIGFKQGINEKISIKIKSIFEENNFDFVKTIQKIKK